MVWEVRDRCKTGERRTWWRRKVSVGAEHAVVVAAAVGFLCACSISAELEVGMRALTVKLQRVCECVKAEQLKHSTTMTRWSTTPQHHTRGHA